MYSLRMRASKDGSHISGGERIIARSRVLMEAKGLLLRAMDHVIGMPDEIHLTIEEIKDKILYGESLPISTIETIGVDDSRIKAAGLLSLIGVSKKAVESAFREISKGASPDGKNMRGAMIIDMDTGKRLEPDPCRGIRVSRMDITEEAEDALKIEMKRARAEGERVKEALILATKVSMGGTLAELCWSDNPDYTTGYVASKRYGYVRFPHLKKDGDPKGGRAFFLMGSEMNLNSYIAFLERMPLLIRKITPGSSPCRWEEFLENQVYRKS